MGVTSLVGAQWGSEGKGVVAAALAHHFDGSVRVGGPNAGHSFYYAGRKYVARSVPCSWINSDCVVMVGAGGVVNPHTLESELDALPGRVTLYVDERAVLITEEMEHREASTIREKIGSTAEGVGQARIAKIARDGSAVLARDWRWRSTKVKVTDTARLLRPMLASRRPVLLEGTQGSGLSLHHGTEYPFCTSQDTNAAGLFSEAGIAPAHAGCTFLVARTFPIRVAGNSGPMGREISWEELGVPAEITTVTRKVRRVAEFFDEVFDRAVYHNSPCGVFLTFADYIAPEIEGSNDRDEIMRQPAVREFVDRIERVWGVPVVGVSTGGAMWSIATVADCAHGYWWDTRLTGYVDADEEVPA